MSAKIRKYENAYTNDIDKYECIFSYIVGLLCTMNALMLHGYGLYNYVVFCWIIYKIVKNSRSASSKHSVFFGSNASKFVMLFFISIILSLVASLFVLPQSWIFNEIKCIIKYVFLFCFLFLSYNKKQIFVLFEYFIKGFFIGTIINMFWGFLQLFLYSIFKFRINTVIFGSLYKNNSQVPLEAWDSYVGGGLLRMKGLGWETANFALMMICGFILCKRFDKNLYLKLFFVLAILLSTSRSGYVAFAVVLLVMIVQNVFLHNKMIDVKKLLSIVVVLGLLGVVFTVFGNSIMLRVTQMIKSLFSVLNTTDSAASNSIHISYYENMLTILSNSNPINILFGNGYFSTGYIYSKNILSLADRINLIGWNPESDVVTLVVGNGMVGAFIYYAASLYCFLKHYKDELSLMIVAIIVEGTTYLLIRGNWPLLMLIFGLATICPSTKLESKENCEAIK